MPYFKTNDVNILLIHIPKTGGTSVENYFSHKLKIPIFKGTTLHCNGNYDNCSEELKTLQLGSTLQHLTYNTIFKYRKELNVDFDNIKIMTIVRNPYERIISDLFFYKMIKIDSKKEFVFIKIKEYINKELDNHTIPQHKFLVDENNNLIKNIHIMKTETLNDDMHNLGYKDFNLVCMKNKNEDIKSYYEYLNDESIKIINQFYHEDFVLFHYDKLLPN